MDPPIYKAKNPYLRNGSQVQLENQIKGDPAGRPYSAGYVLNNRKPKTENRKPCLPVSLGCPKNLVDTEIMLGGLTHAGWEVTGEPAAADLLLVNTCGFIEPACKEAVDTILDLARLKEDRPEVRLVVAGCLVQRYGPELMQDLPEVDLFIGVNDFPALAELLARPQADGAAPLVHQAPPYAYAGVEARYPATPRHLAYLKIAEGCGHGCTFCLIPQIRGKLSAAAPWTPWCRRPKISPPPGSKNSSWWPRTPPPTAGTSRAARGSRRCSGSWPPLTASGGSASSTATRPASPRNSWPSWPPTPGFSPTWISPSSTAMTRCCGAWDGAIPAGTSWRRFGAYEKPSPGRRSAPPSWRVFPARPRRTSRRWLISSQEVGFDHLGVFLYSPEAGTPAAAFRPKVPRREARRRARLLKAIQAKIVKARLKSLVGTVAEVLVEGVSPESDYLLTGRLHSQAPDIDGQVYITAGTGQVGEIQPVRLTRALPYDLLGEIVEAGEKGKRQKAKRVKV